MKLNFQKICVQVVHPADRGEVLMIQMIASQIQIHILGQKLPFVCALEVLVTGFQIETHFTSVIIVSV